MPRSQLCDNIFMNALCPHACHMSRPYSRGDSGSSYRQGQIETLWDAARRVAPARSQIQSLDVLVPTDYLYAVGEPSFPAMCNCTPVIHSVCSLMISSQHPNHSLCSIQRENKSVR